MPAAILAAHCGPATPRQARCHLPVTQLVSDYSLGKFEKRLQIVGLRVYREDAHKDIHRNCG
jgi:hypothetical protein